MKTVKEQRSELIQRPQSHFGEKPSVEKKFKLTDETMEVIGEKKMPFSDILVLKRIQALKDFGDVKKGDLGGFVESEGNLSQKDDAWIYNDAKVFGDAFISGNAKVYGDAQVFGNAIVYENAQIFGHAKIVDDVEVSGNAQVYENAYACGNARIFENAKICGAALVRKNARIYGNAAVYDESEVSDNATVHGNAHIYGYAKVHDTANVSDNACVYYHADVYGKACICGDAEVSDMQDYLVFKNWWSSGRYFTWTRSDDMWTCGCFRGTGNELIEKAYQDSEVSGREYEHVVNYVEGVKERMNKTEETETHNREEEKKTADL